MASNDDYEAMVASLRAAEARTRRPAEPSGAGYAVGITLWSLALAVGAICLVVRLSSPSPARHHAEVPRCTLSAPCYAGHSGGKLIGAYVLVRTARGIVRMPLHLARAYYRLNMLRGISRPVNFNLPSWGDR